MVRKSMTLRRMSTPKPVLDRLMDAIRASELSYRQLAERADVHPMTIGKLMSPKSTKRTLNVETAEKIAEALGMSLELNTRKR